MRALGPVDSNPLLHFCQFGGCPVPNSTFPRAVPTTLDGVLTILWDYLRLFGLFGLVCLLRHAPVICQRFTDHLVR